MEKFYYLVKMTFFTKFAYVKAFWLNIAGTFASIVIYYFLWQFVFRQQESLAGFTAAQMTAYVILSRMLSSQFGGGINQELAGWIRQGTIGMELLRPVSLQFTLFSKRVGEFVFFVVFKGAPIAAVCFLVLGGSAPAGIREFIRRMNVEEKTTFIVTSHDFQDIESLCQRIVLINHGKVILDDQMQKVKLDFNRKKQIQFEVDDNPWCTKETFSMEGVQVSQTTPHSLRLEYDADTTDSVGIIQAVSRRCEIQDITIAGRDIESIIREILKEEEF